MANARTLTIDPKATDIALGIYAAQNGRLTVQAMESAEYKRETANRTNRNRAQELVGLTETERTMVERANAQGKGVLWNKGNGQSYYFVAQNPDEKQAGKNTEEEKEKGGFLNWCKRNWGWLVAGVVAVTAGVIFLVRKNKKKSSGSGEKTASKGKETAKTEVKDKTSNVNNAKDDPSPGMRTPAVETPTLTTPKAPTVDAPTPVSPTTPKNPTPEQPVQTPPMTVVQPPVVGRGSGSLTINQTTSGGDGPVISGSTPTKTLAVVGGRVDVETLGSEVAQSMGASLRRSGGNSN